MSSFSFEFSGNVSTYSGIRYEAERERAYYYGLAFLRDEGEAFHLYLLNSEEVLNS